jgi:hypothetical protein
MPCYLCHYKAILLNHTRKEALYVVEESNCDRINITKTIQRHKVKDWTFDDDIELFVYPEDLDYSKLNKYTELNFISFNKKANLGVCECCKEL